MIPVAYLASNVTLPGSPNRRDDAFEHDQMMAALVPAFAQQGMLLEDCAWDDPTDWSFYDAVIIGTTWDYWLRPDEFQTTLDLITDQTLLLNSADMVRWNRHKSYLRDLEAVGLGIIPTRWIDVVDKTSIDAAVLDLKTDTLVAKRQVGAGADGQFKLRQGDPLPADLQIASHPMMLQPFIPSIIEEGEYSFIYIDGVYSHCLLKRATGGDYRVQSLYGGVEEAITPAQRDIKAADHVLSAICTKCGSMPLYARIDMIRDDRGTLLLMECELIEPFLYPLQGPNLGNMLAVALRKRLDTV